MTWYMWLAAAALVIALGIALKKALSRDRVFGQTLPPTSGEVEHEIPDISAAIAGEEHMKPDEPVVGETVTRTPTRERRQESRPRRKTME